MTASHRSTPQGVSGRDTSTAAAPPITRRVLAGVVGGLAGGLVFGAMMATMGMFPMIASLVGSASAAVGFLVHLVISVLVGLALTVPGGGLLAGSFLRAAAIGLAYGALWWVLGPLLIMPAMMGMPVFAVDAASVMSLIGHLLYGLVLGLVAAAVLRRRG